MSGAAAASRSSAAPRRRRSTWSSKRVPDFRRHRPPTERTAMKRNWILYCLPATLAVVSFSAMPAQAQVAPLDGRVFVADAGETGKQAHENNDVTTLAD